MVQVMATNEEKLIQITKDTLPLSCPLPEYDDWHGHPRVFLEVETKRTACPYCGTVYEVVDFDE